MMLVIIKLDMTTMMIRMMILIIPHIITISIVTVINLHKSNEDCSNDGNHSNKKTNSIMFDNRIINGSNHHANSNHTYKNELSPECSEFEFAMPCMQHSYKSLRSGPGGVRNFKPEILDTISGIVF